jgi:hypothetical protein
MTILAQSIEARLIRAVGHKCLANYFKVREIMKDFSISIEDKFKKDLLLFSRKNKAWIYFKLVIQKIIHVYKF